VPRERHGSAEAINRCAPICSDSFGNGSSLNEMKSSQNYFLFIASIANSTASRLMLPEKNALQ
jgi:hypothetical protein